MSALAEQAAAFSRRFIDLAGERVGGEALDCSDQWFAECANLVKPAAPIFRQGHFVDTGQWMDGWETRRSFGRRARRESGTDHDWCLLRLGVPGVIHAVDIETTHFTGNAPEYASLEGAWIKDGAPGSAEWREVLGKQALAADAHNLFEPELAAAVTQLRLNIYPDGGVARLRAWGSVNIDPSVFPAGAHIDLANVLHGGRSLLCSDRFYSSPGNLLLPGAGLNMGDGWETRRRRDLGNDWCIIKLGLPGSIRRVELDTAHFKGNYPDRFSLEAVKTEREDLDAPDIPWQPVIPETFLDAHRLHTFVEEILAPQQDSFTHVRLNIFPDGGVSRLRVIGEPDRGAWQ